MLHPSYSSLFDHPNNIHWGSVRIEINVCNSESYTIIKCRWTDEYLIAEPMSRQGNKSQTFVLLLWDSNPQFSSWSSRRLHGLQTPRPPCQLIVCTVCEDGGGNTSVYPLTTLWKVMIWIHTICSPLYLYVGVVTDGTTKRMSLRLLLPEFNFTWCYSDVDSILYASNWGPFKLASCLYGSHLVFITTYDFSLEHKRT